MVTVIHKHWQILLHILIRETSNATFIRDSVLQCMEKEKLVDIWFVFRIWEPEVNYGDFICATCILYVDLVENFKFAVSI